jgi:hypothetical protein
MRFFNGLLQGVRSLFFIRTGIGKRPDGDAADKEALLAVLLPLTGLAAGAVAALAAFLLRETGFIIAAVAGGLAVLAALGGVRQLNGAARLFKPGNIAGPAAAVALMLLFEALAIMEIGSYREYSLIFAAFAYLPVASSVAMISAASALKFDAGVSAPLSGVKGWHMALASLLAFALMLPAFGLKSLAYIAVSVLAGSLAAAAMKNSVKKEEAAYVAAAVSEILFLITMMLMEGQPILYY